MNLSVLIALSLTASAFLIGCGSGNSGSSSSEVERINNNTRRLELQNRGYNTSNDIRNSVRKSNEEIRLRNEAGSAIDNANQVESWGE